MHRLALALALLPLFDLSARAQDNKTANYDMFAVRSTVTNYIEGYFTGDAQRMEQPLHPHFLQHHRTMANSNFAREHFGRACWRTNCNEVGGR